MTTPGEESPLPTDPWQRMAELGELLDGVSRRLKTVAEAQVTDRAHSHRTRQLATGLAVSLVLDVILTVVVAMLSASALGQSDALHAAQLSACTASNETRAEQRQLWEHLFQLSGPAKTQAQAAQENKILSFVNATFAPVNCAQAYR